MVEGLKATENHLLKGPVHDVERILESLDAIGSEIPSQHPPSLDTLFCVIQRLLFPEPLYTRIADFLRLLSMVEFWRLRAMSVISNALVYQEYYKDAKDQDYTLLPQPVEDLFKDHEKYNHEWRSLFMKIVSICIELHLQRLWITGPNTEFWAQWNEYYSPLKISLEPSEVSPAFHHQLSIKDIGQLLFSMENCKDFINGTLQGQGAARITSDEILPMIDEFLLDLIHSYLNFVRELITEVHEVFPTEFPLPTI